jgi:hypothetical protein
MPSKEFIKRDRNWPEKKGGRPASHGLFRKIDMERVDGRTQVGMTINHLKNELREFVADSSPSTELLITRITYKAVRLMLYEARVLSGENPEALESEAAQYLPMANSLRVDLQVLSQMAGKPKDEAPDLAQYVNKKYGKEQC